MGLISNRLAKYPKLEKLYRFIKKAVLTLFIAHLIYTILLIWLPVVSTPTIFGEWLWGKKIEKTWVSRADIAESMKHAVIASEDQEFDEHFGFDVEAIEKAVKYNKKHKNSKKGASTISQQVAKNVFLWQGRTWIRKGFEVYCTLLIELLWSKERILEVYLNVAEMGDGVYGCEAAAQKFFKKPASKLTDEEAALIAACLPSPKRYKVDAPSDYVRKRQRWILWQMRNIEWE
jgi:monofunctional biosynthetic peptidoglycan transglycosylase